MLFYPRFAVCRWLLAVAVVLLPSHGAYDGTINAKTYFPASGFPRAEQRRLASRLLGKYWLRDIEAEEYLQRITRQLAPRDEHFIIVADADAVNAFAYLGGLMVVYRGLWQFADEEDGFVGVVAHELGHIKLNHVEKTRDNANQISALTAPLLIAGLLIDAPEAREALVVSGIGAISSNIVAYSRELEHEADIFAFDAMQSIGRDAQAMVRTFSRLEGSGNEYISTHPAPERRGAYLRDRLHDTAVAAPSPELDYYLLREKLARQGVVERQYQQVQRAILASDADAKQKLLAQYGLLLSATKTRNKKLGEEMVAALAGEGNPLIIRALAENLHRRGKPAEALKLLKKARQAHPERLALLLELFAAYTRLKQPQNIVAVYQDLPPSLKDQPDVLLAAGRAAAFARQRVLSNYLLAYGQAQSGDFEQAQKQIIVAERFKDGDSDTLVSLSQLKRKVNHELYLLRTKRVLEGS